MSMFPGEEDAGARAARRRAETATSETDAARAALAAANQPQLAAVETAAVRAGGVVSGAQQDYVDRVLGEVRSGVVSASDALKAIDAVYSENAYKLTDESSDTSETGGGENPPPAVVLPTSSAASDELKALLDRYGIGGLFSDLNAALVADPSIIDNEDALFAKVRNNPMYMQRFAGNQRRVAAGLPELTVSEYISQEQSYKTALRNLGMPRGFYDNQNDFANFIANDVSPAELTARIQSGYKAVTQADPEVVNNLKRLYKLDDSQLAAYFLDPERSMTEITRQVRASEIAARAAEQGRVQLDVTLAENLAQRGYTGQSAATAFTSLQELQGLYTEMTGEQALSQAEKVGAAFGYDVTAAQQIAQRKAARKAAFQGGGGFARTTGATSGTVETGVGTAQ